MGKKKEIEASGSSPHPSSKKRKVSKASFDQRIEQLNDVTAKEEEELFSGFNKDIPVSNADFQDEEDTLIVHTIPLRKKIMEIMAKSGLKSMSNDVVRGLSLGVQDRMRGFIANMIRLSKQRVDIEKSRHRTIITSDIRQQIMAINCQAREEWEKKHAAIEKPESSSGVDGDEDNDENRVRSTKEENYKMWTTAAANNVVRAATGVDDVMSRWQLMAEAKQKQGGAVTSSSSSALVKKDGRNQVLMPQVVAARSITVKDVVAALEREPQMSKSTLIYQLCDKF